MMEAARLLSEEVGIKRATDALGVPRASYYRSLKKEEKSPAERSVPKRALDEAERDEVKDVLYSDRFCDKAPREVYAVLLDEGRYLCSVRTMYRILDDEKALRKEEIS